MIQWFTDALLLNVTADADGTPDRAKVSSEEFLFNLSAALLKLCQPFVNDPKKTNLVDPGFVSSPESHGGVYDLKGDNALPRLGVNISDSDVEYNPKNSFIPLCFFFCSRSLALSIIPGGNRYKSVAIHVSHAYHDIRQENGDARREAQGSGSCLPGACGEPASGVRGLEGRPVVGALSPPAAGRFAAAPPPPGGDLD